MPRNPDKTQTPDGIAEPWDKKTDYRMFSERGESDKRYLSFEGERVQTELDNDELADDRFDLRKLCWATDTQRGLIDNKWW